ncbi:MAG: cupin domain-containing protein [Acidimicrobiia bacterium]
MSRKARATADAAFRAEGLAPHTWSNEPGYVYGEHVHDYHKVLFCTEGSITFHTPDGDVHLEPGDRVDLLPGTPHSATVGWRGVTCVEAARR